jgi:hypothetical protein
MMAKRVHTAKHTVNAMVDIQSARLCPATPVTAFACMMTSVLSIAIYLRREKPGRGVSALTSINRTEHLLEIVRLYLGGTPI